MSSQCLHQSSDASIALDKTRPATCTSDSAIELDEGSGSRKRKRDAGTVNDLLRDSFVVKPYPPQASCKVRSLQPLLLLSRSQLPLSYLDILASSSPLPSSRLFESHVKILELEGRMGTEPVVLIARLEDDRSLFAVEREDRGLYVICKLGSWVSVQELRAVATVLRQDGLDTTRLSSHTHAVTQDSVAIATVDPTIFSKKKRLAIEAIQSMVKRPSLGLLPNSPSESVAVDGNGQDNSQEVFEMPPVSEIIHDVTKGEPSALPVAQPSAVEILENIRTQYFDALYLSKASLAYFAKGPLSRARAAFHLDYESKMEMSDLVSFLEGLVMSTSIIDKKYKDGLPNIIALIDIEHHSAEDDAKSKTKKKRANKKMKLGKNGLFPMEDDIVRKWWASHDEDFEAGAPGRTREEVTKTRLAYLRIRETQLQMILILEILALKPLASPMEDPETALPGDDKGNLNEKPAKSKKPEQLLSLMDVHIDRLCIWQSISSESVKSTAGDSQVSMNNLKHSDNITRDFCVDIIAPFFASRLPEQCTLINRKLGGPVNISPPKTKLARSASASSRLSRPGAATKRPVPVKSAQSLSRVLTDERERERRSASAQPNRKLSLMRAATMPLMPGLKREDSEAPSLSSVPTSDSQSSSTVNKSGFTTTKRFGHREVDFSTLTREKSSKSSKQAQIDNELKVAIAALKKPNRELAGKTFVDSIETRTATGSQHRKSRKPVRNPFFDGVQISATPKINRQTDKFSKSQPIRTPIAELSSFDFVPPSSVPGIPQSSLPSQEKYSSGNPFLATVEATPTRKSTSSHSLSLEFNRSPINRREQSSSFKIHARRSSASLFASVPDSSRKDTAQKIVATLSTISDIQETPVKTRLCSPAAHCHPLQQVREGDKENDWGKESKHISNETVERVQEENIYKSLGWDDDIDDLA